MQSENMKGKFYAVKRDEIEPFQAVVDCKIDVGDISPSKVLSSNVSAQISATEVLSGELTYQGIITIDAVILTEQNETVALSSSFPFSGKIENALFDPNQKVILSPEVVDVSIEEISSESIRFIVVVETKIEVLSNVGIDYFEDDKDEYVIKESTSSTTVLKSQNKKDFNVAGEVVTPEKVKQVLSTNVDVIVKSIMPGTNYVAVSGDAEVSMVLINDDEKNTMTNNKLTIPFKEEIEIENANKESDIVDNLSVRKNEITTVLEPIESGTKLRVSFPIESEFTVFETQEFQTVEDLYSLNNQTLVATGSYAQLKHAPAVYFESKIDGTITLDDSAMRIDKIVSVSAPCAVVTNAFYDNGQIIVSGIAKSTLVFYNEETNSINSTQLEIPFEVYDSVAIDEKDVEVFAKAILTDVDVSVKRGREIFFDGKLKIRARLCYEIQNAIISSVQDGDELPEKTHAIEVYFATSGQTPWDIAKDMREDVAVLYQYNQDLKEIMEGNEKIVVYRQREINFD